MACTDRFSFRAIDGLSRPDASNVKSCASSAGVHGRPVGRGPSFIWLSPSAPLDQPADGLGAGQIGLFLPRQRNLLRCSPVMMAKRRNWETGSRVGGRTESRPGGFLKPLVLDDATAMLPEAKRTSV